MELRSIQNISIKNKRVLLRVDFNVPLKNGKVADDFRIREAFPTIRFLLRGNNAVILMAHLGRPKKKTRKLSMEPVARYAERIFKKKIVFIQDPFHKDGFKKLRALQTGEMAMIENIRFWKGEEKNDALFAKKLGVLGDVFVNDAFGASHRAHASVAGITKYIPSYAGLLLLREVRALSRVMRYPARPFLAILGGVKIADKLPLLNYFLRHADGVLLSGALANTVLAGAGFAVGRSHIDHGFRNGVRLYRNRKILFPLDVVAAEQVREKTKTRIRTIGEIMKQEMILDIGPKTLELFSQSAKGAKTIVWNGPLGMSDLEVFSAGTVALAKMLKKIHAFKVVGGGDTVAVLRRHRALSSFSHVSTGGGAMLEFLAGKKLPGVEALKMKNKKLKMKK